MGDQPAPSVIVGLDDLHGEVVPDPSGWVAIGMVTSVDGAVAVDGTSGQLGGDGDLASFRAVRALADVILVGAGTVRAEDYRPRWTARDVEGRAARGQPPLPRLAVVCSRPLPPELRVLDPGDEPPNVLLLVPHAVADDIRARDGHAAEVVGVEPDATGRVDVSAALEALAARGLRRVVVEGGPELNGQLLAAGRVDELFVTVAPTLVGTDGPGLAGTLPEPWQLELRSLRVHGSELLARYRLVRS